MSLAQRFERRLEGMVGSAFARVFKGQVEPVEIGNALQREAMDKKAVMGSGQVLAPNRYRVTLGSSDYERLAPWEVQLTRSLAELVQEYLDEHRLATIGDVEVYLARDEALHTGVFVQPFGDSPGQPPAPPVRSSEPEPPPYVEPPRRAAYHAQLMVDGTPRALELTAGSNIIGRGADSDLQLMDQGVSRRHADVHITDGQATVYDLGSTNGTSVNGHGVQSQQLQHGDVIRVGHTRLVFHEDSS
jgi:hypothetical protein